jgi:hypothetical protein
MKQSNSSKQTNRAVGQGLANEVRRTPQYETGAEVEQRTGSPLCRGVEGIRTGRRTTTRPPDPRTTRDSYSDEMRVRWCDDHDAAVGLTTGGQRWKTTQRVGDELQRALSEYEVRPPADDRVTNGAVTWGSAAQLVSGQFSTGLHRPAEFHDDSEVHGSCDVLQSYHCDEHGCVGDARGFCVSLPSACDQQRSWERVDADGTDHHLQPLFSVHSGEPNRRNRGVSCDEMFTNGTTTRDSVAPVILRSCLSHDRGDVRKNIRNASVHQVAAEKNHRSVGRRRDESPCSDCSTCS